MQTYSNPSRESDPHALPDVEVFYMSTSDMVSNGWSGYADPGWYYWFCFPGCLPDSEPCGPFATQAEAIANAQSNTSDES